MDGSKKKEFKLDDVSNENLFSEDDVRFRLMMYDCDC